MTSKAIRVGAALAGVLALAGFSAQAQAQFPRQVPSNFRLPLNGTLNGAGMTPFGGISFGVGAGGGLLPVRNLGVGGLGGLNGIGLVGGTGVIYPGPTVIPSLGMPSSSYLSTPGYGGGYGGGNYNNYAGVPSYDYLSTTGGGTATLTTNPSIGTGWGNVTPGYDPMFSNQWWPNPSRAGGYLTGAADLTASYGNFMVSTQRARLIQEEANRSQIDTRRRIWEEAAWERMNTVFTEDYRLSLIKTEESRARMQPPISEIWSGRSLNVLLRAAAAQQSKGNLGQKINIPEDILKHINVTVGTGNGNIGMLRADTLRWPLGLQGPDFADEVKDLNQRIPEAREQARLNPSVAPGLIEDIQKDVERMQQTLRGKVSEMAPPDYAEAKRFLNNLSEAVRALQDPNVQNYLTGKFSATGKTVAELVDNLTRVKGLEFAPATPGDEAAYRVLYQLLQAYDASLTTTNTSAPAPSGSGSGSGTPDKDK